MTPRQIDLVRAGFASLAERPDAAALFYGRLFELDPGLRALFRGDMAHQGQLLTQALAFAVGGLDRPDAIAPTLAGLGRRHVGYGVREGHYDAVGAALLWTVEQAVGPGFTAEAREAWASAYEVLSSAMKAGAAAVAA